MRLPTLIVLFCLLTQFVTGEVFSPEKRKLLTKRPRIENHHIRQPEFSGTDDQKEALLERGRHLAESRADAQQPFCEIQPQL
jgi:hypothetical protein